MNFDEEYTYKVHIGSYSAEIDGEMSIDNLIKILKSLKKQGFNSVEDDYPIRISKIDLKKERDEEKSAYLRKVKETIEFEYEEKFKGFEKYKEEMCKLQLTLEEYERKQKIENDLIKKIDKLEKENTLLKLKNSKEVEEILKNI
jgi:hypothetical protein